MERKCPVAGNIKIILFFNFLSNRSARVQRTRNQIGVALSKMFMSVGWDVKWCPVSKITPSALKRPFHWISMKCKLVRAARETSKF